MLAIDLADPRAARLKVDFPIDVLSVAVLAESLVSAASRSASVVVDLSACSYIDSSGISAFVRFRNGSVVPLFLVVPPTGSVRRILAIAGLESYLGVVSSAEDIPSLA